MIKYRLYIAAIISVIFALAHAPTASAFTPPTKNFPPEASGTYQVDTSHANILFSATHLGLSNYFGRFNKMDGTLKFDAKDVTKSTITMKVHAASVDSNNSEMEAKFQGAEFLNAEKFPVATFTSTKIEKLSDDKGRITGDLSLLGITKPIILDVVFNGYALNPYTKKPTLGFSAKGSFKRSDFGMIAYIPDVGDEVSLIIEAEFSKAE
jgi:polyisoprenoid-binding protein YceI